MNEHVEIEMKKYIVLKNPLILQNILKYLNTIQTIQFLTYLNLNKGWSYQNMIITVGEN